MQGRMTAEAPHIAAQALRDAASAMMREKGTTLRDALLIRWLHDRADSIEGQA